MNNDRFKFRVWDIGNKCYIDYPALSQNGCLIDEKDFYLEDGQFIIEQCTGLKDKNGTLIYENDIVFYYGYEKPIEWHNGFYIVAGAGTMTKLVRDGMCEIIGNVHETKE